MRRVTTTHKNSGKDVNCLRTLIVGNGIDIQYGGFEQRGNKAILDRAIKNIESGKYNRLGWQADDLISIFNSCLLIINRVIENDWFVNPSEDFLFLQMEMDRVRRSYKHPCELVTLGIEDYFLGAELGSLNASTKEEGDGLREKIYHFLQPILLDAIYDDGKVNEIYKSFPKQLVRELQRYDAIYTINYDTNLENCLEGKVPIYHLHGCFNDLKEDAPNIDEYRHMFCNGIMTWYWLEKYGNEGEDVRYGTKQFEQIEGLIDIIGISPCNDEQLYIRLWQNPKLRSCNFYYYDRCEAVEIRKHIGGNLGKHITDRDVKKFWSKFGNR